MTVDRLSLTMDPEVGSAYARRLTGDVVLTSDPDDLNRLLEARGVGAAVRRV